MKTFQRANQLAAAGSVHAALVVWVSVLTYNGGANIRIDVPIFGTLCLLTVAAAAMAVLGRVGSGRGALSATAEVIMAVLTGLLTLFLVVTVITGEVPDGVRWWAALAAVVGAATQVNLLWRQGGGATKRS